MIEEPKSRKPKEVQVSRAEMSKLFDHLPPHAIEAEMCLLGSLIVAGTDNIHLIGEAMQVLRGEGDFFLPKHATIYRQIIEQYDQHQALDLVLLQKRLRDQGVFDMVGGMAYLTELAEGVPTPVHAVHYAQIVRDKAKLRQLIDAAGMILHDAHESTEAPNVVVDKAEQRIFKVAEGNAADEPTQLSELVQQAFTLLQERSESGHSFTGISTGYHSLDDLLGGLQAGDLLILAARPSMGKTAFALNLAQNIAVYGKQPVAVFSLEMSKQQLTERLLSAQSGVDSQKMRRNMLNDEDIQRLQGAADELSVAPIFIDDTPGITALTLRAKARRLVAKHSIKCIIIDYMQLMSYPGAESRQVEVSAISRSVKALAREMKVPVICLSQLNRNPEGRESKRPMLSDLRESGSIEQDADVVMMLHREDYYHHDEEWRTENADKLGLTELIICKQRNGPTDTVYFHFAKEQARFVPAASAGLRAAEAGAY